MKSHWKRIGDRATTAKALRRSVLTSTVLVAAGTLVAACGSGLPSGGVPSLGTHTSGNPGAGSSAAGANEGHEGAPGSQAIAYSACMRSHGVPNFPDPEIHHSADGTSVRMVLRAGTVTHDPQFASAQQACRKLLPNEGRPPTRQTVTPQEQTQYLKAAACIRSHGVPGFPDPTFEGGGVHIDHQGLDLNSPTFKAAVEACKSLIPGGVQGSGAGSHHGSSEEAAP